MRSQQVKAFAPATVANLGVGFDVLGMAVEGIGDTVTVEAMDHPGIEIVEITGDNGSLTKDPLKNTCAIAAQSVLKLTNEEDTGIRIWLEKGLPLSSGLGSSAASAVATAVAVNKLLGEPLLKEDLLPAVLDAETAVSGKHLDNVAPALLGGIVLITGLSVTEIHRLPVPDGLFLTLTTPAIAINTADARAVLPSVVPLDVVVHQTGVVAELVHALHVGNIHLLCRAMQRDAIVEGARESLIPHLAKMRELAHNAGALATIISGSGPTICSFSGTQHDAEAVSECLKDAYQREDILARTYVTKPNKRGAFILPS